MVAPESWKLIRHPLLMVLFEHWVLRITSAVRVPEALTETEAPPDMAA
jgi:hypothetical protein